MNNKEIKNMTKGAVIAALYIVIIAIFRLTNETDFTFLIFPLPLLIYYKVTDFKWCLITQCVVLVLSFFIVGNLYSYIGVVLTNVIASLIFVFFINKSKNQILSFTVIYLTYIFLEFFVLFYTNYFVFGIDFNAYVEQTITEFTNIFAFLDVDILKKVIYITIPISLIIYALLKIVINYLLYYLVSIRLGLASKDEIKLRIVYSKIIPLVYVILLLLTLVLANNFIVNFNLINSILYGFMISIVFIFSLYLMIQGLLYIKYLFLNLNLGKLMLIALLLILLFPISIVFGLISNFKMR